MSELLYKTLRESVVNAIRTKIMKRQIRPGERIVELELAQEFHTSRGPIREALRQLEIEGLVEYTRNVGCSVRRFSLMDSYEAYLLRTNYEIVSIRLLNGKIPKDTIEYDNRFHEQLVIMSKLPRLEKAWKELYFSNLLAGYELLKDKGEILERQYENHLAILAACKEGDCEKICQEVKKHYWRTIYRILQEQENEDTELEKNWMMAI